MRIETRSILLAIALAVGASACGNKEAEAKKAADQAAEAAKSAKEAEDKAAAAKKDADEKGMKAAAKASVAKLDTATGAAWDTQKTAAESDIAALNKAVDSLETTLKAGK
jgi:hypothetical protein